MTTLAIDVATEFKTAFRYHPAGISLITAETSAGPVGLTASSVASVAVDPPVLSFSVTRATGSAGQLLAAESILVHLLDASQASVAQQFAISGGERFTPEQGWSALPTGEPYLPGVRAALRCRPIETVQAGSSTLVLAEVIEVHTGEAGDPLIYHDRTFRHTGEAV